ncbi:peptidase C39 [Paraburkholderia acidicola]|uniref:Peptidase C39 n=1 Tax=Paraburkholderia acidicola TaxID=1912599 RepID=A0ABV1LJ42_9BURK
MKRQISQLGFALCATACSLASSAFAAESIGPPPIQDLIPVLDTAPQTIEWQAVDDDVLANQTGKYAGASMISGFVLNLLSQWQLPNGATAIAQGTLAVATNTANQLSATVNTLASVIGGNGGNGNSGANPNAGANGGQSISVNGVSQVTQVAGDRNVGVNSAQIDFSDGALGLLPGGNNAASANASNAAGTIKAGIAFGNGGVTVALQTPAGLATQTIAPNSAQQAGAIAQLLQIAGNNQQVANQLQLHLQTQQMSPAMLQQAGVLQALQNAAIVRR